MVTRTGSARFPSTDYKTTNHIIAYLDILGATNKICNDDDFSFLNHLNMFMEDAIEESGGGIFPHKEKIFIKIFSDNILLAIELKENDELREDKIAALFNTVANIYNEILRYGYLMRGAIVEGEFFHNDKIVYGKALVEAVHLEEKVANVPRILVKTKVNETYSRYYLMQDKDDELFLNIFHLCNAFDDVAFKINLLEMLKKHKNDEKIKIKILWMTKYFNSWFTKYEYRLLNQQKITDEEVAEALK
ncbi:MAG: hypothetical protein V8S20_00400 [Candidatus Gastranaerophilaceae bacterium]